VILVAGHPIAVMVQLVDSAGNNITSPEGQEDLSLAAHCSSYAVPGPSPAVAAGGAAAFPGMLVDKGPWCDPVPEVGVAQEAMLSTEHELHHLYFVVTSAEAGASDVQFSQLAVWPPHMVYRHFAAHHN
jgi:hypothetical protein